MQHSVKNSKSSIITGYYNRIVSVKSGWIYSDLTWFYCCVPIYASF